MLLEAGEELEFEGWKVLILSRGGKLGDANKEAALRKRWENVAVKRQVWNDDLSALKSELEGLRKFMK